MASQGPYSGATFANDTSIGGYAWANPGNAASSDDIKSINAGLHINYISNYLKATNFSFSIPADATINGIKVDVEVQTNGNVKDWSVKIVKGGVISGSEMAPGNNLTASDVYYSFGGTNSLWGLSWDFGDINANNFGVVYCVKNWNSFYLCYPKVDHIRMTVYYTEAAAGPAFNLFVSGALKDVPTAKIMVGGAWKSISAAKIMVNGVWKSA